MTGPFMPLPLIPGAGAFFLLGGDAYEVGAAFQKQGSDPFDKGGA